ncbi:root border cell-specific protein, partial [Trifolium pratense]
DLAANPKCSVLLARDPEDRTDLVITLHGDAVFVPEKDNAAIRAAYLARHPNAFWVTLFIILPCNLFYSLLLVLELTTTHIEG